MRQTRMTNLQKLEKKHNFHIRLIISLSMLPSKFLGVCSSEVESSLDIRLLKMRPSHSPDMPDTSPNDIRHYSRIAEKVLFLTRHLVAMVE